MTEQNNELNKEEREVIEQCGTEPRFSSDLLELDEEGVFKCKKCGQELFASDEKYESGSGWPSFWDAKSGAVEKREDDRHGMVRTEVVCSNCEAHLGHVFDDGPQDKTGKRYCINGIALKFNESA
ncbi:MAG: peptide-methionine (R)-S-oxide reductase [Candidatus Nanohaloarchaea archaeon]|jgi:peptide-methionine (R)-S-oxide reductase